MVDGFILRAAVILREMRSNRAYAMTSSDGGSVMEVRNVHNVSSSNDSSLLFDHRKIYNSDDLINIFVH